jgi:hypothetical protein
MKQLIWDPKSDPSHGFGFRLPSGSKLERVEWIRQFFLLFDTDVLQATARRDFRAVKLHFEGVDGRVVAHPVFSNSSDEGLLPWAFFTDLEWEKQFRNLNVEDPDYEAQADALYQEEAEILILGFQTAGFQYHLSFHVYDNPKPFREVLGGALIER